MAEHLLVKLRKEELQSSDFLVSMFWAAMTSYRHDTVLRPFPPMYQNGENKNIEKLVSEYTAGEEGGGGGGRREEDP